MFTVLIIEIRAELLDEHRRQREQKQRDLQNQLDTAKVKKKCDHIDMTLSDLIYAIHRHSPLPQNQTHPL
jgi:hypothetical protein